MPKLKPEDLEKIAEIERRKMSWGVGDRAKITIHMGTCGIAAGARNIKNAVFSELEKNMENGIRVIISGCAGLCSCEPMVTVERKGEAPVKYVNLTEEKIRKIVKGHIMEGKIVEEYILPEASEAGFFGKQRPIVLRNRGLIDPGKIEYYIARDGYKALIKALTRMSPQEIIQEIKDSGLRGRGGAGFLTGKKWELCRKSRGNIKYIICNGDEGDPGAYMDRSIIESDPHAVLEGMIIGAKAIGASHGFIYLRSEYPLALKQINLALGQARESGLLGKDILGTGFDFDISVFRGAGAFVCGEETSLIASLEGRSPEPRLRPPFPAESGLWNRPTNINNVETWATVPQIILNGAGWYAEIGTETSKGTKVFSLVGKVKNTGLVEVPMGITLKEMVFDIGDGIQNDRKFKAVQTGGPSGGCIPVSLIDLPIDYEKLSEAGSIMGSGGMIVMDENTCMVDIAKYFIDFLRGESCGKCTSCREGTEAMYEILNNICEGRGRLEDIDLLEELAEAVQAGSLCGLGTTAPNPVLSTLRYFRDEYEAHIKYKRCPAVVCKGIISSPCQHICPLGQDVPCYIGLVAQGRFDEAVEIVKRENPLPAICGRVCLAPCEDKCRAGEGGEDAISIRGLKRFVADYESQKGPWSPPQPKMSRAEKVAIIGSGPAGLTCGFYLALEGYGVTIFESLPIAGGMLAVGIPDYRLPKQILEYEIENIKKTGVEIKTGVTVGKDVSFTELKVQYQAVYIATGAHRGLKMNIEGEDSPHVIDAVEFLRRLNLGYEITVGQKVAVIGGGNAAVDAARTAKRLGKDVEILYRRTRREMPAAKEEVEQADREGIKIQCLVAPIRVLAENEQMKGVECIRMELGDVDRSGRRRPVPIEGSEFTVEIDTLIPAISQEPDVDTWLRGNGVKISKWNTIEVDPETFQTAEEGVFAGGDVVTGPKTVAEAMGQAKIAARMIDNFLRGEPVRREYEVTRPAIDVETVELTDEETEGLHKIEMPHLPTEEREGNFKEVELGFTREMAVAEAKRCLRCDLEVKE
ncbi:MAG: FAD-dependent oxidoreductase [bacterium]